MKTVGSNRRAFPRVPAAVPVEIVRPDRLEGKPIRAALDELSQMGAVVTTNTSIPAGDWINLRPDRKGAGYGADITAVIERVEPGGEGEVRLICRFPNPLDYATLMLFR
jgi:hypothetical protein